LEIRDWEIEMEIRDWGMGEWEIRETEFGE